MDRIFTINIIAFMYKLPVHSATGKQATDFVNILSDKFCNSKVGVVC